MALADFVTGIINMVRTNNICQCMWKCIVVSLMWMNLWSIFFSLIDSQSTEFILIEAGREWVTFWQSGRPIGMLHIDVSYLAEHEAYIDVCSIQFLVHVGRKPKIQLPNMRTIAGWNILAIWWASMSTQGIAMEIYSYTAAVQRNAN